MTLCKDSKAWTWQDPGPNEEALVQYRVIFHSWCAAWHGVRRAFKRLQHWWFTKSSQIIGGNKAYAMCLPYHVHSLIPQRLPSFSSSSSCTSNWPLRVLRTGMAVIGGAVLAAEADGLVSGEMTDGGVDTSADSEAHDDTKGPQLGGNVLDATETL